MRRRANAIHFRAGSSRPVAVTASGERSSPPAFSQGNCTLALPPSPWRIGESEGSAEMLYDGEWKPPACWYARGISRSVYQTTSGECRSSCHSRASSAGSRERIDATCSAVMSCPRADDAHRASMAASTSRKAIASLMVILASSRLILPNALASGKPARTRRAKEGAEP